MNPIQNSVTCDEVDLESLLFGEESSSEFRNFAAHVESCPNCQSRLAALAADDSQFAAARAFLAPNSADATTVLTSKQQLLESIEGARHRPPKLDFLSAPSHPELLGRLGRYDVERVIGAGGMGIVLKGFDTELNRPVAIKVLSPHLSHSTAARQRFAREARAAASIVHEHVVAIHDVDARQDSPYLVMQYIGGQSLAERVDEQGSLSPTEVLRIAMQAAAGLDAAHSQGIIHRDVKPGNILLENGVDRAMLTDFGLARAADDATLTHSGVLAGTPHYMSPEQARGEMVDARSDLFSLGSVMYFMVTGHPPFRAEHAMAVLHRVCTDEHRPVQEVDPSVPDALADTIDRLLEKRPSRRYASAAELQHSLERSLARLQQPQSMNWGRWLRRRVRRSRAMFGVGACTLLALAMGWWLMTSPQQSKVNRQAFEVIRRPQAEEPMVDNSEAGPFVDIPMPEAALSLPRESVQELSDVTAAIRQLEREMYPTSSSTNISSNAWAREVNAIQSGIRQVEQNSSPGPNASRF